MYYRLQLKECEMLINLARVRSVIRKHATISFNYIVPFHFQRDSCYVNDTYTYDTEAAAKETFQQIEQFLQKQQQKPLA